MPRKYIRYVTQEKLNRVCASNKKHIQRYFSFKNMNLSESSKKSYESDFNQWLVFIREKYEQGVIEQEDIIEMLHEENGIEDMVDLLEDYISFCCTILGNAERRIQRRMSSISSFFLFLRKKRKIKESPMDFLERPSVRAGEKPQIIQTYLMEEQIAEIRQGLRELGQLQLELYFEFSLSTLARVNAVSNVKVDQINFEQGIVTKVLEKEGYLVDLFPSDYTMELIRKWLLYRKEEGIESEFLFITKYGGEWKKVSKGTIQTSWIKKIGSMIGIPYLHAHDLRHTGSSILYNKGLPLEDVQKLLNHRSPETTLSHYIQKDMKKLKNAKKTFEI